MVLARRGFINGAVGVLTAASFSQAATAESFDRAPSAQVGFSATPISAKGDCRAPPGPSAVSARLVPTTGKTPAHCRLDGFLPTEIGFQINLPLNWNGRLYMFGNGGYAGEEADAPAQQLARDRALERGFATARTDTGHLASKAPLAAFALDETALVNHAYQAVHATVTYAKEAAAAYYGLPPRFSYWDGCSTGGRQGLMSATLFPKDFNGILAKAPTLDWTSIMIKGLWRQAAVQGTGLTIGKLKTVFDAVLELCDANDGLRDGLLDDPRRCAFDVRSLVPLCTSQDSDACLTDPQADALRKIYDGPPKGPGTPDWLGELPGFEAPSTSAGWVINADSSPNQLFVFADSWMKFIAFKDPDYDSGNFDFVHDPPRARAGDDMMNPKTELDAFRAAGGKMITYWGWSDTALNAGMGIAFYDQVLAEYGLRGAQDFYRFFLVPGVAHCQGGYGPDTIDAMTPLIAWVEHGVAPERLAAQKIEAGKIIYNRAYCPYPLVTRHEGGDPETPENYRCTTATGS